MIVENIAGFINNSPLGKTCASAIGSGLARAVDGVAVGVILGLAGAAAIYCAQNFGKRQMSPSALSV